MNLRDLLLMSSGKPNNTQNFYSQLSLITIRSIWQPGIPETMIKKLYKLARFSKDVIWLPNNTGNLDNLGTLTIVAIWQPGKPETKIN